MTEPLLTVEDIRLFIQKSIAEAIPSSHAYVSKKEMKAYFKISEYLYLKYKRMGMPHKMDRNHPKYNLADVHRWMQGQKKINK